MMSKRLPLILELSPVVPYEDEPYAGLKQFKALAARYYDHETQTTIFPEDIPVPDIQLSNTNTKDWYDTTTTSGLPIAIIDDTREDEYSYNDDKKEDP